MNGRRLLALGLAVVFVALFDGAGHPAPLFAQEPGEGVLHNLARAIIAVPAALVDSLKGSQGGGYYAGYYGNSAAYGVRFPGDGLYGSADAGSVSAPSEAVAPTVGLKRVPRYITYSLTLRDGSRGEPGQGPSGVAISGPISFGPGGPGGPGSIDW